MVRNPLSKKGWLGVGLTVIFSPILVGFLNEFGADLYGLSKQTVAGLPFQTILTIVLVTTAIGIIVGIVLIIYDLVRRRGIRIFQRRETAQETPQTTMTEALFDARIIRKKQRYIRGKDAVWFRSRFKGHLTNGFFANQIFAPEVVDGTKAYRSYFEDTTPDLDADKRLGVIFRIITLPYCNIKYKENARTLIPILYVLPRHLNPHVLAPEYIEQIFEESFPQAKGSTLTDIIIKNDEKE